MPFSVSEIQPTPNPNALKFILDQDISEQPLSFLNPPAGAEHPIARLLFEIPGVTSLLLLGDFVTINKSSEARWDDITGRVRKVLASL